MKLDSIRPYLRHYGKIRTLRGSVIRSTFQRVQAGFDDPDDGALSDAMTELEQDPFGDLRCVYCGSAASCWDHLVPAARGGTHQVRNLAPSCAVCNLTKGARTWQEFLDDLPDKESTTSARRVLEEYTADFIPKPSCVSAEASQRLAQICDEILAKMAEADEIVAQELKRPSAGEV